LELKSITLSLGPLLGVHKEYEPVAKSIVKNILSKFGVRHFVCRQTRFYQNRW